MALTTKQNTFTVGSTILSAEHNTNFDDIYNDYNGNITNANISGSAAIADSKLAQITTASKVHGTSITGLASVPSGAGVLPEANTNLPIGGLLMWCTDTAPTGWLLCDGTAYDATSDTTKQDLFDVIANAFGGADNTDFQVPDMRGRFPLGQDDMGGSSANRVTAAAADTVGSSGGSETIDITQIPAHTHTVTTSTDETFASNVAGGTASSGTSTSSSAGGGLPYTQPFLTLNFVIRFA